MLGIQPGVGESALKRAFRKCALRVHPDRHPEEREAAEAEFKEVNEAYALIASSGAESSIQAAAADGGLTAATDAEGLAGTPRLCLISASEGWGLEELVEAIVGRISTPNRQGGDETPKDVERECDKQRSHSSTHGRGQDGVGGERGVGGLQAGRVLGADGSAGGGSAGSAVVQDGDLVRDGGRALTTATACGEAGGAIVVETAKVRGLGMTMVVVVRAGVLQTNDWFAVGAASGKIRRISLLQAGGGRHEETVDEVGAGRAARLSVSWRATKDHGNHFEVGAVPTRAQYAPAAGQTRRAARLSAAFWLDVLAPPRAARR